MKHLADQLLAVMTGFSWTQIINNFFPIWVCCECNEPSGFSIFPAHAHCILVFLLHKPRPSNERTEKKDRGPENIHIWVWGQGHIGIQRPPAPHDQKIPLQILQSVFFNPDPYIDQQIYAFDSGNTITTSKGSRSSTWALSNSKFLTLRMVR